MSSAVAAALRPIPFPRFETLRNDPAAQAFVLLRVVFSVAPILFGLDKFAHVLNDHWALYLAPEFNDLIPGSAADAMHLVGIVESRPAWWSPWCRGSAGCSWRPGSAASS